MDTSFFTFIISNVICFLCMFLVGLRLYYRKLTKVGWGWDDGLILVAMILVAAMLALSVLVWKAQAARNDCHKSELLSDRTVLMLLLIFNVLYIFAACFTKLSALCLYIRIFTNKAKFKLMCKVLGVILAILYIAVLVQEFTVSGIAVELWSKSHIGSLTDKKRVDIGTAFYTILGNVIILILPLPLIWKLQMRVKKKILLTILFLSGLSVTLVAGFRLLAVVKADYDNELVAVTGRIMNLQVLEPELAIFSLCLQVLYRFWRELLGKCFSARTVPHGSNQMDSIVSSRKREEGGDNVRWDEFLRSEGNSRYSVNIGIGSPSTTTASNPGYPLPHERRLARDPRVNPDRSANSQQPTPINVNKTWGVLYEETSGSHRNA
ncbi:hypothetical protein GGR53DRAFT_467271 [Hypoxylon sp. FL1150]|nr:hypothetical protein GGR53DRAFT_467271 [Hypoxylon sp. FL1150]